MNSSELSLGPIHYNVAREEMPWPLIHLVLLEWTRGKHVGCTKQVLTRKSIKKHDFSLKNQGFDMILGGFSSPQDSKHALERFPWAQASFGNIFLEL